MLPPVEEALLDYIAEPLRHGPTLRDAWSEAVRLAGTLDSPSRPVPAAASEHEEHPGWLRPGVSARFCRSVRLPSGSMVARLADWWAGQAQDGVVTVARRLRLGPPQGGADGWTMHGRVRRMTRWHWVPVVVEVWPRHGHWLMVMTPQTRVVASRRYFRSGNLALDRLGVELAGRWPTS